MKFINNSYYIMGSGVLGNYLYKFFSKNTKNQFLGFLDNNQIGENIFNPKDIEDKNVTVIVGSITYIYEMFTQLKDLGYPNILTFVDLLLEYPELQSYNASFNGLMEDYKKNFEKYERLKTILADDESIRVLNTMIEYRKTFDINLYPKIARNSKYQYFDFGINDMNIFIDGGAFDGDTIENMKNLGIKTDKIYLFEPDEKSLGKASQNLKKYSEIKYYPYGLSDKNKVLKFENNGTLGSCFSDNGNIEVKCVSLDEIVKEERCFIKLDIEGAEVDAIIGAKRLLKNASPFAICVYHKPSDIWKIPELMESIINEDNKPHFSWKFYLRHYSNTIFETVLYGIPDFK